MISKFIDLLVSYLKSRPFWPLIEPVDLVAKKPFYNVPPAATPNPGGTSFSKYGTLWSYGPAYPADASVPPQAGTTPFTLANAKTNVVPIFES